MSSSFRQKAPVSSTGNSVYYSARNNVNTRSIPDTMSKKSSYYRSAHNSLNTRSIPDSMSKKSSHPSATSSADSYVNMYNNKKFKLVRTKMFSPLQVLRIRKLFDAAEEAFDRGESRLQRLLRRRSLTTQERHIVMKTLDRTRAYSISVRKQRHEWYKAIREMYSVSLRGKKSREWVLPTWPLDPLNDHKKTGLSGRVKNPLWRALRYDNHQKLHSYGKNYNSIRKRFLKK